MILNGIELKHFVLFFRIIKALSESQNLANAANNQNHNVNHRTVVKMQGIPVNVTLVVEFQRWWVLKSKNFSQKSIFRIKGSHCIFCFLTNNGLLN